MLNAQTLKWIVAFILFTLPYLHTKAQVRVIKRDSIIRTKTRIKISKRDSVAITERRDTIIKSNDTYWGRHTVKGGLYENLNFNQPIDFLGAEFKKNLKFSSVTFKEKISFNDAILNNTEFNDVAFLQSVGFNGCSFKENIEFIGVNFYSTFKFTSILSMKKCSFLCTFHESVNFDNSVFYGNLFFGQTEFLKNASFVGAKFIGDVKFDLTQLPDTLNFAYLQLDSLKKDIDFRMCFIDSTKRSHGNKCVIILSKTDVSKLVLPSHLFTVDLGLYNNLLEDLGFKNYEMDELTRVYEQLIKKSRDLGLMSSSEGWDIEYQTRKNELQFGFSGKVLNFINLYWWNFGYSKGRILWLWLPLLYIIFSTINYFNLDWMVNKVYFDDGFGKNYKLNYKRITTVYERIAYSLFYTAAIYFNFRLRHEAVNYMNLGGLLYLYVIYLTGILNVAFGVLSYIPHA